MGKNKRIHILLLIVLFLSGSLQMWAIYNQRVPSYVQNNQLQNQRQLNYSDDQKTIRIYLPKDSGQLSVQIEKEAQEMIDFYRLEESFSLMRAEGELRYHTEDIASVVYTIYQSDEVDQVVFQEGYLFDLMGNKKIVLSELLADQAINRLKNEWLTIVKEEWNEYYNLELFESSSQTDQYFDFFFIGEEEIIFSMNRSFNQNTEWRFSLAELADYLKYSVGEVQREELSLFRYVVDPDKPMVALTFDDGPHKEHTPVIIDSLMYYNSAATFFVVGNRLSQHSEIFIETYRRGNQIGNHSWSHPYLSRLKNEKLQEEFDKTMDKSFEIIQSSKMEVYRPPYGYLGKKVIDSVTVPIIMWSYDTEDWKVKDAQVMVEEIMKNVQDGDIILLHDIHLETAEAMDYLLPQLIEEGYQIVTISQLMEAKGIDLEEGNCGYENSQENCGYIER